ncbi:MAG: restriction endonuclease subunit S, partial [Nitrospira sp.]|nr:restriction endonuclease subunit S [Nitrospira sp.]
MGGEWKTLHLGDLADLHQEQVDPSDTPAQLFEHYSIPAFDAGQVPVMEPGSSIASHKFTVPCNAVLLSKLNPRIPRVWKPAAVGNLPRVASTEFLVLLPKNGIDGVLLKYLCLSPSVRAELQARATGTSGSHQRVRPDDALNIDVSVPVDHREQRAIACILGALDDKIELNRRMNRTLEEMARALFKSWFVDFDPVRAKAAVRREHPKWTNEQVSRAACPNLKPEIAALFPDSFEPSELGDIPKGWRVCPIGEVVQVLGGGTPSTKEAAYWKGGIHPFCTPKDMASLTDPVLLQTERHLTDEGLAKVSSGQLPAGTVL